MKYLLLSGHGVKINVDSGKLHIQDGRSCIDKDPEKFVFRSKECDYGNIVIYGHNGHITFEAMRWLVKQNIQLTLLDWNGRLLTSILPIEARQTKLKFAQYQTYQSPERIKLAKNIINAKIKNSKAVLTWLKQKYPHIDNPIEKEYQKLPSARTVQEIMTVEARVAQIYWKEVSKIFEKKFEFTNRANPNRPFGAVDPINALFNYGYALLESQCQRAINASGLDTHVGFIHEITAGKTPLVYDLQEPFRCLVDIAIINGLEKKLFSKEDFIRTENYNIRLRPSGAKKLIQELEAIFNQRVNYRNGNRTWAYIIMMKASELGQFLIGKRRNIDFGSPKIELKRSDNFELRKRILSIPYSKAKEMGFSKGTLWYMKQNAKSEKPFRVYEKVKEKLVRN